jgi:hypothetical protein
MSETRRELRGFGRGLIALARECVRAIRIEWSHYKLKRAMKKYGSAVASLQEVARKIIDEGHR